LCPEGQAALLPVLLEELELDELPALELVEEPVLAGVLLVPESPEPPAVVDVVVDAAAGAALPLFESDRLSVR
jgi:hypothetical protein